MKEDIKNKKIRNSKPLHYFGSLLVFLILAINLISYKQAIHLTQSTTNSSQNTSSTLSQSLFGKRISKPVNAHIDPDFLEIDTIKGDVDLEIWKFDMQPSTGVVALFHDYQKTKSSLWKEALSFYRMGYTVILVDLRGSGNSGGNNSTFGYSEAVDVENTLKWCTENYPGNKIYLFGASTGAVAILRAVSELQSTPDGIIIQTCNSTLQQSVKQGLKNGKLPYFSSAWLVSYWVTLINSFNTEQLNASSLASSVEIPTLLIHGMLDEEISFDDSQKIFKSLKGPKEFATFSKSGHESILNNEEANWVYLVTNFMQSQQH